MRNGLTFGMLDQRDPLDDNATVREAALEGREDYEWAAETKSREIVEALLGGISLDAKIGSLSGGQRRRADLARLLLKDWDILALDEPTNHLDVVTIHWLAEHLKNRWPSGQGALLLVTHDRWFLDEVCESMWEVHDGVIDPFEGGYSAYMLQRVERDRQADVRETKRRNLARKELAWLTRGARARSTKQKFHVKAARELIADVPPVRNTLELKQMATSRLGKQVVDLIDVTQIFEHAQGEADIDPDVAEMEASASRVDVVPAMYAEPQAHGSVEVAVDDLTDPRLVDAGVPEARQAAQAARQAEEESHESGDDVDESTPEVTSAARKVTVTGRKILDDVTWLIGPGDRFGIVGANGAGKSTLLKLLMRYWDPQSGLVALSEVPLPQIDAHHRRRVQTMMGQETYLFDGTIRENLLMACDMGDADRAGNAGDPDDSATSGRALLTPPAPPVSWNAADSALSTRTPLSVGDDVLRAALAKASALELVDSLPQGLDTSVGELGGRLSEGERQRIGLARVFLRNASLVLFDEPTSRLDAYNESVILQSIDALAQQGSAVLLVSHRDSTMRIADRIVRM